MSRDLLEAVRDLPKCSPYLHVPAQCGSNAILERMKRGYTVEEYREMMQRIGEVLPGAAVSSDFIVGFCGETEEDYQQTVTLVEECRFKNSFIFKYSERPGTKGAERSGGRRAAGREEAAKQRLAADSESDQRRRQSGVYRPRGRRACRGAEQTGSGQRTGGIARGTDDGTNPL